MARRTRSAILERAMSPEVLDQAWRDIAQERAPWSPDLSEREDLTPHFTRRLLELREEILEGRYEPYELREFTLPQPGGRRKLVQAQYLRDKLAQRAVYLALRPRSERYFHPLSLAYRPGRNAELARQLVRQLVSQGNRRWLYWGKIDRFYDHARQKLLLKRLRAFLKDRLVERLMERWLAQWCRRETPEERRIGVPRGTVLSPFYLNFYLHELDRALAKRKILFIRFGDQFTLLAPSERVLARAEKAAATVLASLGLPLTRSSGRVAADGERKTFVGEDLTALLARLQSGATPGG